MIARVNPTILILSFITYALMLTQNVAGPFGSTGHAKVLLVLQNFL